MLLSCGTPQSQLPRIEEPGRWIEPISVPNPALKNDPGVPVRIYIPRSFTQAAPRRAIIALHGYRGNYTEWGSYTNIQKYAEDYGIAIVCPDMGGTLYETGYYPETQVKWNEMPGGRWIPEILIPYIQTNYGLARSRAHTGILGVSTGARGALLLSCLHANLFQAAAGISGYYDTTVMTGSPFIPTIYGPYATFKDRWVKDDNIMELAARLADIQVFLAHGFKDRDIPIEQSQLLGIKLRQLQKKSPGKYQFEFHELPFMSHGWVYWREITGDALSFFNRALEK
jgi:putative tributyrin esterase